MSHDLTHQKLHENNKAEYVARVLRVQDYIEQHLDEDLSLEKAASVAYFSGIFH
jgi:YesN/AraC family two-component response regulator